MKIAVYTALYGNKDILRVPISYRNTADIDYFVFTDNENLNIYPYKTIFNSKQFNDVAKNARYFKILGDPILQHYDYVIWHDANINIKHNYIINLTKKGQATFLVTFTHPNRNDFYSEAMSCIRVEKDFSLRILRQVFYYFIEGMPAHHGMYATGILIKNQSIDSGDFYKIWWKQTLKHSRRDQLSIAYTIFKTKAYISVIDDDILSNKYSTYYAHEYLDYKEEKNIMLYNFSFLKKLSYGIVKGMRKFKKLTQ